MVDIIDSTKGAESSYEEQMQVVFPKAEEELINFLNRCNLKDFEVMLCPRCSAFFNKETTKELEKTNPYLLKKVGWQDQHE